MVKAMLTHEYTYAYGAVSPLDGRFDSLILPHVNTDGMQIFSMKSQNFIPTRISSG
jgi:hypothetical protein